MQTTIKRAVSSVLAVALVFGLLGATSGMAIAYEPEAVGNEVSRVFAPFEGEAAEPAREVEAVVEEAPKVAHDVALEAALEPTTGFSEESGLATVAAEIIGALQAPPVLTNMNAANVTHRNADVYAYLDSAADFYVATYRASATPPTVAEIVTPRADVAHWGFQLNCDPGNGSSMYVGTSPTGLDASTSYVSYMVAINSAGDSGVVLVPFTTKSATPLAPPTLSNEGAANVTHKSADIFAYLDEIADFYAATYLSSATPPTIAEIITPRSDALHRAQLLDCFGGPMGTSPSGLTFDTGYTCYMVAVNSLGDSGVVAVPFITSDGVCAIEYTPYPTLAAALAEVQTGETINLLQSITEATAIDTTTVGATAFFVHTDGHTLSLGGERVYVGSGRSLGIVGGGTLAVGRIVVEGGSLDVYANISADVHGVEATNGAAVMITGNITSDSNGVFAGGASTSVIVNGWINSTGFNGVYAYGGASITVNG
ncbi:MAG: hypothetical protein FWE96_06470, partial [Coriobacteriia bacterium]|nr:hypothetical protein [Coriobacteriia bacterium]